MDGGASFDSTGTLLLLQTPPSSAEAEDRVGVICTITYMHSRFTHLHRYLHAARRQLREEKSDLLRQWHETINLLQDTATRHMRVEEACDGASGFV